MTDTEQMGRLAMRVEGDYWVAYYALPETMDGSLLLGSVAMAFVMDKDRKRAFISLMREAVGDLIEARTGQRPIWPDPDGTPAPEHEKAGRA